MPDGGPGTVVVLGIVVVVAIDVLTVDTVVLGSVVFTSVVGTDVELLVVDGITTRSAVVVTLASKGMPVDPVVACRDGVVVKDLLPEPQPASATSTQVATIARLLRHMSTTSAFRGPPTPER